MKIIHLLNSSTWNGEAEYALRCALAVRSFAGCEPVFVTDSGSTVASTLTHHRFRVEKMSLHGLMKVFAVSRIGNLLREADCGEKTVLHLHSPALLNTAVGSLQVAGQGRAALVGSFGGTHHPQGSAGQLQRLVEQCGAIVCPDDSGCSRFGRRAIGVSSAFRCASRPADVGSGLLEVLYVGNIDAHSGVATLVDDLCRCGDDMPPCRLTVAGQGEGRYVMPLVRKVRAMSGRALEIEFIGPQAVTDEFLERHHLMVLPGTDDTLSAEIAKVAMARGLGVVRQGSDVPGMLGPFARVDGGDWAATIRRLAADRPAVEALRRESLAHAIASWSDVGQFGRTLCSIYSNA